MYLTRVKLVVLIGGSLYLAVIAFASGVAAERIRFDRERSVLLHQHDEAIREWHGYQMAIERSKNESSATAVR
jgi:hypothetical protein